MTSVSFYGIPAHGHVNPSLPVVADLVRRGVDVVYYSSEDFRARIEGAGARFATHADLLRDIDPSRPDPNHVRMAEKLADAGMRLTPAIVDEIRRDAPDCVIHDSLACWGRWAAHAAGVPAVCSMTTFALDTATVMAGSSASGFLSMCAGGAGAWIRTRGILREARRRWGVDAGGTIGLYTNAEDLTVVYTSRELQPMERRFGGNFLFVGPSIPEGQEIGDFPIAEMAGKGPAYVSLGTIANDRPAFYRDCVEAFRDADGPVVMSIGRALDPRALGDLPERFIVRGNVPQIEVLRHASVFVTHSGMNSVNEALWYGVPLVLVPQTNEQEIVARRVEEVGAGVRLGGIDAGPAAIRDAVLRALRGGACAAAARRIGDSFRASGGWERAASAIMEVCAGPRVGPSPGH